MMVYTTKKLLCSKIWSVYVEYNKRRKFIEKFYKICNLKFLKQPSYIRYVLAKLSEFGQISMQARKFLFSEDSLKIEKALYFLFI